MHEMRHDIREKHSGEETSDVAIPVHCGLPSVRDCDSLEGYDPPSEAARTDPAPIALRVLPRDHSSRVAGKSEYLAAI